MFSENLAYFHLPSPFLFHPLLSHSHQWMLQQHQCSTSKCLEITVKQGCIIWWKEYMTWTRKVIWRQWHLFAGWTGQDLSLLGTCFLSYKMNMMVSPREVVRIKWVQRFFFFFLRYFGYRQACAASTRDSDISKPEVEGRSHIRGRWVVSQFWEGPSWPWMVRQRRGGQSHWYMYEDTEVNQGS